MVGCDCDYRAASMDIMKLLGRSESLVAVDFGSTAIKLVELNMRSSRPTLTNFGLLPLDEDIYSGNVITHGDYASEQLLALLEANSVDDKRIVTAMPGPSVFTKKIKMDKMDLEELRTNIQFEAGSFIPHNIDAVQLDFHVLGEAPGNQLDILVVAVKNEIIDGVLDCIALAGLETAIVDVDYFALQNIFEFNYPEHLSETVALIDIGSRFSSICICRDGGTLFTGDMSIGGNTITEELETQLGLGFDEAEELKKQASAGEQVEERAQQVIHENVEHVASEFNRQLSFFWSASGAEEGIDRIFLTGGGSLMKGLREQIAEQTGIETLFLDPLKEIDCEEGFDEKYLKELSPVMSIGLGLSLREPGDRILPEGV